ncbi:MAG TPA: hypothetical protein EYN69_11840, partial [Flavobacteriales bacterium]|nr:hypothetical protein [Flavobacteriales bacterium]
MRGKSMKRNYDFFFTSVISRPMNGFRRTILLMAFLVITSFANATHITGGEIYYKCIGVDSFEVTLLLWRDCSTSPTPANLSSTAVLNVYFIEGGLSATGFPVTLPRLSYDTLDLGAYGNSCFIPPPGICVQEGVYRDTIVLPFASGGYLIAYECGNRNIGIANLVPLSSEIGTSLIMNVPMTTVDYHPPTVVWFEDFEDRSVGDEDDVGSTAWSTACASTSPCGLNDSDPA